MIRKLIAAHMALMGIALTLTEMGNFMLKQAIAANEARLKQWAQENDGRSMECDRLPSRQTDDREIARSVLHTSDPKSYARPRVERMSARRIRDIRAEEYRG